MPQTTLNDIESGAYIHDENTGKVYQIAEINAEIAEDGVPEGAVSFRDIGIASPQSGETFTRDAEKVDFELYDNQLAIIDSEIIENADEILREFADQEIGNYLARLDASHDYNGIDHASTIRDIKVASVFSEMATNNINNA